MQRYPNMSQRPQWQKSKSHSAVGLPTKACPPLPVSEVTKSKLQQFQFFAPKTDAEGPVTQDETTPTSHDGSKSDSLAAAPFDDSNKENNGGSALEDERSLLSTTVNPAKTPVGRLAWRDLLGETHTPKKHEASPSERIMWNDAEDTTASSIFPMISRRQGRKRARSSSPISSPSNSKSTTPVVNVKKLAEALKTPHGDPSLELWDRFSLPGEDKPVSSGLTNPLLAHLMVSSSPRPVTEGGTTHGEISLRRAFSCGTQWPKRRKLDRLGHDATVTYQGSPRGASKSSMVSALLETVTGEINRSSSTEERVKPPASPSPQKKHQTRRGQGRPSPSKSPMSSRPIAFTETDCTVEAGGSAGERALTNIPSSDYGDDDFDDDTLLELDASMNTFNDDDVTLLQAGHHGQDDIGGPPQGPTILDDAFDEVDDDVFDVAEVMLAEGTQVLPDTTHQNQKHGGGSQYATHKEEDNQYSDAFGSDFDIEAVEIAATQQTDRPKSSLVPVCTAR